MIDSIQACEANIQALREQYNGAVRTYETLRLSIPAIFVAGMLGFSKANYLEFDVSGMAEPGNLKDFKTDDGERLQQLLSNAGGQIMGVSKIIATHATQAGKLAVDTIKDKAKNLPDFFYQLPGGVPMGPVKLQTLIDQVESGQFTGELQIAEVGSSTWCSFTEFMAINKSKNSNL